MSISSLDPIISLCENENLNRVLIKEVYMNSFWHNNAPEIYEMMEVFNEVAFNYFYEYGLDEFDVQYSGIDYIYCCQSSSWDYTRHLDETTLMIMLDKSNSIYIDTNENVINSCQGVLFDFMEREDKNGTRRLIGEID